VTGGEVAHERGNGQSMVETLVLLAVVTAVVAVPIDGQASLLALVLDAVRTAWQKFITALALAA
jgi:hypothetical protein